MVWACQLPDRYGTCAIRKKRAISLLSNFRYRLWNKATRLIPNVMDQDCAFVKAKRKKKQKTERQTLPLATRIKLIEDNLWAEKICIHHPILVWKWQISAVCFDKRFSVWTWWKHPCYGRSVYCRCLIQWHHPSICLSNIILFNLWPWQGVPYICIHVLLLMYI